MVARVFHKRENGFTLIELLIVCVIMGVLAAAVVPNLTKFIGSGAVGAANTELATVKNSVVGYLADHSGNLPCAVQPTVGNPQPLAAALIAQYLGNAPIKGGYLVDASGTVTGDPNNAYPSLTWDASSGNWTR
jgi:type IV pilus assembly protein PilA